MCAAQRREEAKRDIRVNSVKFLHPSQQRTFHKISFHKNTVDLNKTAYTFI